MGVAPLGQGQGGNIKKAGGGAVQGGPGIDGVNPGRLGGQDRAGCGEGHSQSHHGLQPPTLLPAAHQEHEYAHRSQHKEYYQPGGGSSHPEHLLPQGRHGPGKTEGQGTGKEDGQTRADEGQKRLVFLGQI